jgi:hypothetical protein
MKIPELNLSFAFRAAHTHDRIKSCQRDTHIARMCGNALFALAENRVNTIVTIERPATAAGFALVACRKRRIVKVITARALQQIAAYRRHVAQLRTRSRKERFAQNRVTRFD